MIDEEEDFGPYQEPTDLYYRIQLPSIGLPEDDPSWRKLSACLNSGVTFFSYKPSALEAAKAICAQCPVTVQCLAFAVENDQRYGIWGGVDENERKRLIKTS